ncbi:NAD-dependent epimerase/dehydratase family protein [Polynucleobacter sinensis]|uniref:NAD-dependent epimerase/dehydratase family protein n=1 Tax=Polynucleobacter sinensis TaxID=1743157 RepID=UPI0007837F32|nr:NAD(P)-dependent oxidoreductase [Polynucleobacter sinensis]
MKIFLTGGTGFVGSHFLAQALADGHEVIALRRPGSLTRIPLMVQPRWIEGSLDENYEGLFEEVDVFVHMASHTPNPPYDSLEQCTYWNVYASLKLTTQAIKQGVKKYVIAGSCFEYGKSAERFDYLDIDTPLEPTLSYPTSKAAASVALMGLAREKALQLKLLRIFQVYGEGEPANRLWPSLRAAADSGADFPMSKGEQLRDFIRVEEVAKAFIQALDFSNCTFGSPSIQHVATGCPQSVLEFSQYWWNRWQARGRLIVGAVPYRHNEMMRVITSKQTIIS